MSQLPFYLLAFAGVLGVLIFVHELGHFLAARACGVKVLRFSVGFGRPLWIRRFGRDRTEWVLAIFPLGGYVKMLDEREAPVSPAELPRAFNRQSVGRRSFIVAAGPLTNLLAAVMIYWGVFFFGSQELLPVLGEPAVASLGAQAGIENGEQVLTVDGEAIVTYEDLRWRLLEKLVDRQRVLLEVVNESREHHQRVLDFSSAMLPSAGEDPLEAAGIRLYRPKFPAAVGKVSAGSPADKAGLRAGDRLVALNDQPLAEWFDFVKRVRESPGQVIRLEFERGGEVFVVDLVPELVEEAGRHLGRVGVALADQPGVRREIRSTVRYDFLEAGAKAVRETWEKSWFSLQMMGRMLVGEVSWKNLSGPVTIADYAGQSARLGLDYYFKFMALVSISLGVLNLLPIPVLDGGHLMYHMIEVVRRRPLSEQTMERFQQVGLSLLVLLMAFAFFNDLTRLLAG